MNPAGYPELLIKAIGPFFANLGCADKQFEGGGPTLVHKSIAAFVYTHIEGEIGMRYLVILHQLGEAQIIKMAVVYHHGVFHIGETLKRGHFRKWIRHPRPVMRKPA